MTILGFDTQNLVELILSVKKIHVDNFDVSSGNLVLEITWSFPPLDPPLLMRQIMNLYSAQCFVVEPQLLLGDLHSVSLF